MHKVCLSICLSKPIKNELLYFWVFSRFNESLLEVIDGEESKSDIGFLIRASIG